MFTGLLIEFPEFAIYTRYCPKKAEVLKGLFTKYTITYLAFLDGNVNYRQNTQVYRLRFTSNRSTFTFAAVRAGRLESIYTRRKANASTANRFFSTPIPFSAWYRRQGSRNNQISWLTCIDMQAARHAILHDDCPSDTTIFLFWEPGIYGDKFSEVADTTFHKTSNSSVVYVYIWTIYTLWFICTVRDIRYETNI